MRILFFLLFTSLLVSEEINIKLSVDKELKPLYIAEPTSTDNLLSSTALKEIDKTLQTDVELGGFASLVKRSKEREALVAKGSFNALKQEGIRFLIIPTIKGRALSLRALNLTSGEEHAFNDVELATTGSSDRHKIHRLSDKIQKLFFGVEGIASTRILFTDKNGDKGEVYMMDYDGQSPRQLTTQSSLAVTPTFLPPEPGKAASHYFYVSYKTGQPKIYLAQLSGGNGERVTTLGGNQLMPAVSRDNRFLYFISDAAGNPDIFVQPLEPKDKPRQIYAVPYATQASPTLSPDGKRLAFVSSKDGDPKIYVMDIPSPGMRLGDIQPKLLVKRGGASTAPQWSPDGSKIAYTSKADGARQIFVYTIATGENSAVTSGPGNKENPTWAPDSLHLAYNQESGKSCDIYMLNINQLKPIQLTKGNSEKKFPAWESR